MSTILSELVDGYLNRDKSALNVTVTIEDLRLAKKITGVVHDSSLMMHVLNKAILNCTLVRRFEYSANYSRVTELKTVIMEISKMFAD